MPNNLELPLFTYGSLMTNLYNYERHLKNETLALPIKARVHGSLFHLAKKGYPALLPGEGWVYGEVFHLKSFRTMLSRLDVLETYNQADTPNEYNREILIVELWNDETQAYDRETQAYVYRYAVENDTKFLEESFPLPTGDWRAFYETSEKNTLSPA